MHFLDRLKPDFAADDDGLAPNDQMLATAELRQEAAAGRANGNPLFGAVPGR